MDHEIRAALRDCQDLALAIPNMDPAVRDETRAKARHELESAVGLYGRAREQLNVLSCSSAEALRSREMLVLAAEAGVVNGEFELAADAAKKFFLSSPPKDQFYARSLFVMAACDANEAEKRELNGSESTRQRRKALNHVLQALKIAQVRGEKGTSIGRGERSREPEGVRTDFVCPNSPSALWE